MCYLTMKIELFFSLFVQGVDKIVTMKKTHVPVDGGDCVYGFVFQAVLEPHGAPLPDWSIHQQVDKHQSFPEDLHVKANSSEDWERQACQVAKHLVITINIRTTLFKGTPCYGV